MSDSNDTTQENAPVLVQKNKSKFAVGGFGSWLAIGLMLLVVLTVLIVRSQDKEEDVLAFAPADSYLAVEIENVAGAAEVISGMPLWKQEGFDNEKLLDEFIDWFGQDEDLLKRFLGIIKSFTYIESFVDRKPEKMVVLRVGNTWDIESYFRREYSTVTTPVKVASDMTGLEITRKDKSVLYLKKVANFIIMTENKALLKRALAAFKKNELSLAECNIRFGDGDGGMPRLRMYAAINSYFINYPQERSIFPPEIYGMIAGDSAFLYEATVNEGGFVAEGRVIKSIAAAYATGDDFSGTRSGGFWSVIGWIILVILIIVIGIPLLFIIATLILALYFFLIAWWKGELVDIDPPLAEVSKEMKEDVASGKSSIGKKNSKKTAETVEEKEGSATEGVKLVDKDEVETVIQVREDSDDMNETVKDVKNDIANAETMILSREKPVETDDKKTGAAGNDIETAQKVVVDREEKTEPVEETEDKGKEDL